MNLKEIAESLGVSPATVSLVLNNRPGVSEETRKRVREALNSCNYPLKNSNKNTSKIESIFVVKYAVHGMVVEENQGFISSIIDEITQRCHDSGIDLCMAVCNRDTIRQIVDNINKSGAQGVIFIGTEMDRKDVPLLKAVVPPVVVIDNNFMYRNFSSVLMTNVDIAYLAVQHLIECGYKEIGYLYSAVTTSNFYWRRSGYENALADYPEVVQGTHIPLTPTLEGAYEDMHRYLLKTKKERLSRAFFADNDTIAIGAMRAIQEHGYRIPEDISIIGVDNISYSAICTPPLTTISISRQEIGAQALNLLKYKILKPQTPPIRIQICGELMVRKSTMRRDDV